MNRPPERNPLFMAWDGGYYDRGGIGDTFLTYSGPEELMAHKAGELPLWFFPEEVKMMHQLLLERGEIMKNYYVQLMSEGKWRISRLEFKSAPMYFAELYSNEDVVKAIFHTDLMDPNILEEIEMFFDENPAVNHFTKKDMAFPVQTDGVKPLILWRSKRAGTERKEQVTLHDAERVDGGWKYEMALILDNMNRRMSIESTEMGFIIEETVNRLSRSEYIQRWEFGEDGVEVVVENHVGVQLGSALFSLKAEEWEIEGSLPLELYALLRKNHVPDVEGLRKWFEWEYSTIQANVN